MTDKIAEGTMVSLIGGSLLGVFPYIVAIPAAVWYGAKTYYLIKNKGK